MKNEVTLKLVQGHEDVNISKEAAVLNVEEILENQSGIKAQIFVVLSSKDNDICALYNRIELAEAYISSFNNSKAGLYIKPMNLNPFDKELEAGAFPYHLTIHQSGSIITAVKADVPFGFREQNIYWFDKSRNLNVCCFVANEAEARLTGNKLFNLFITSSVWNTHLPESRKIAMHSSNALPDIFKNSFFKYESGYTF
ncbi:hypothetical protein ACFQ3S_07920 [Mucilaginibacter terrae]|uniref:hypothetical protein n=1 Tax=Mucilaginibacter terrae TaxID=1955052 RepID=UPI0036325F13